MTLDLLGWLGTASQIGGALWLSNRPRTPIWAYLAMTPGSMIWLGLAWIRADWSLAAMMGTYTVINSWGIWRWSRK